MKTGRIQGLDKFQKYLKKLEKRFPLLKRDVLNNMAFKGRKLAITELHKRFILRNKYNGDTTSRVFEYQTPIALEGEKQKHVRPRLPLFHCTDAPGRTRGCCSYKRR